LQVKGFRNEEHALSDNELANDYDELRDKVLPLHGSKMEPSKGEDGTSSFYTASAGRMLGERDSSSDYLSAYNMSEDGNAAMRL
jgi:hypothetical protein